MESLRFRGRWNKVQLLEYTSRHFAPVTPTGEWPTLFFLHIKRVAVPAVVSAGLLTRAPSAPCSRVPLSSRRSVSSSGEVLCLLCACVHRGGVSQCGRMCGECLLPALCVCVSVCAAKWCSVCVCVCVFSAGEGIWMENGQAANFLGSASLQIALSHKLPTTLPYPRCPTASPSNSPLSDSEILKCRAGSEQPLAQGELISKDRPWKGRRNYSILWVQLRRWTSPDKKLQFGDLTLMRSP